ncbi:MAG TPA: lysoplasmalogenase family protein [Xanthomarina sp.]|nr:lysoplasmalogenase family protein [Xanthomarina sp.]
MMFILKNKLYFSVLYFSLLLLDIIVKLNFDNINFRFFSKPLMLILLFLFYIINNNEKSKNRRFYVIMALLFLLVGEMFVVYREVVTFLSFSIFCFTMVKIFYIFRFSNQNDFNLIRLLPILSFCFLYILVLFNLIYDNLDYFLIPVLLFLFLTMIIAQFVYLRKSEVDYRSYLLVAIGVTLSIVAETMAILDIFYNTGFVKENAILILLYSISHYLIILGLVTEKIQVENKDNLSVFED